MIIFDEKKHAEQMIKKGFLTNHKNVYELFILAKYYFYINNNKKDVKDLLIEFCKKHKEYFNLDEWYKIINRTVSLAEQSKLITGKTVKITKNELNVIQQLEDLREQKLAFTMLVLYKFHDYKKFKVTLKDLFELSDLNSVNTNYKTKLLHSLNKKGLIDIDTKGRRWVNFSNNKGSVEIVINNFYNFIFYYLQYIGEEKFKKCNNCGCLIKIKNNYMKYCINCSYEKRLKRQRKYMKNKI